MSEQLNFIYNTSIKSDAFSMMVIEEQMEVNRRRLWIRNGIKDILEKHGKNPSDELLDAATTFAINNCILPSINPKREGWFIEMLCCFCGGKKFNLKDYNDNV